MTTRSTARPALGRWGAKSLTCNGEWGNLHGSPPRPAVVPVAICRGQFETRGFAEAAMLPLGPCRHPGAAVNLEERVIERAAPLPREIFEGRHCPTCSAVRVTIGLCPFDAVICPKV